MESRDQNGLTEREFLAAYRQKDYPHPYLTADVVLFSDTLDRVLLIRRKGHPCLGRWAMPGGFVNPDESAYDAALRELEEETGIDRLSAAVHEIGLFSKPGRDPRGWIVSDAFTACIDPDSVAAHAGDDASDARWFQIKTDRDGAAMLQSGDLTLTLDDLAFDHAEMLRRAYQLITREERTCIESQQKPN